MNTISTLKFEDNQITLPVGKSQFEDFIKSLLGQPQALNRFFDCRYVLRIQDVGHVISLISQRIGFQNTAHQADFTIQYNFSDQSTVTFKTFDAAERYNELKPVVPIAVHLLWTFLIQFPDRPSPEKQEIAIRFIKFPNPRSAGVFNGILGESFIRSGINLEIRHTNRTWAIDIESIVANYVASVSIEEGNSVQFLRKNSGRISFIVSGAFLIGCFSTVVYAAYLLRAHFSSKLADTIFPAQTFEQKVESYLDFVALSASDGAWTLFNLQASIFLILSAIIALFLAIFIADEPARPTSHILLTQTADKEFQAEATTISKSFRNYFLGSSITVILGVSSNYIFLWLNQ